MPFPGTSNRQDQQECVGDKHRPYWESGIYHDCAVKLENFGDAIAQGGRVRSTVPAHNPILGVRTIIADPMLDAVKVFKTETDATERKHHEL